RYNYSLFMNTLHDFNFKSRKADGPARVIFTQPKLVKLPNSGRIYFIDYKLNSFHYITHPSLFGKYNWSWQAVFTVEKDWLDQFSTGVDYTL
ncbi:MAG: hypothetical protein ABH832_03980, partial [bacterium]